MATFDESFLDDFDEIPCEFCDELYPIDLLIEHQSGCRPDLLHFNLQDSSRPSPIQTTILEKSTNPAEFETQKKEEKIVLNTTTTKEDCHVKKAAISETTEIIKSKPIKFEEPATIPESPLIQIEPKESIKFEEPVMTLEETLMQEGGTKIMAYGSNMDMHKRVEEEKPSFKAPSLPLLNNATQKDEKDEYLSEDSDEGESLEDFWRRAEIKISQRFGRKVTI